MPHVFIQYREDFVACTDDPILRRLKRAIGKRGAIELSVPDRQLDPGDFSFMCSKEGPDDELAKDLVVIILAHNDDERLKVGSDELAGSIGEAVGEVLANLKCHHPRDLTYSVSLPLCNMGYFADGAQTQ